MENNPNKPWVKEILLSSKLLQGFISGRAFLRGP